MVSPHLRCCFSTCIVSALSEGHSDVLWSQMLLGDEAHDQTSEFHRHKPTAVFLLLYMSSLARSKVVRDTMTENNTFHKSMDEDVAEVVQAKDKPSSRIRAYSNSINCFSLLNRVEGIQHNHHACRWPSGRTSYQGLSTHFCYQQVKPSAVATARLTLVRKSPCCEKMWGFHRCQHGHFKHGPID